MTLDEIKQNILGNYAYTGSPDIYVGCILEYLHSLGLIVTDGHVIVPADEYRQLKNIQTALQGSIDMIDMIAARRG